MTGACARERARERKRRERDRRRRGVAVVNGIELGPELFDALCQRGLLGEFEDNPEALRDAVQSYITECSLSPR